jgi:uncharacterized membrane protein YagU involved in acid resistance
MSILDTRSDSLLKNIVNGAEAGFLATLPMSILMVLGWMLLPEEEQYPLPPREITGEVLKEAGVGHRMDEQELTAATVFSHFVFGAAAGAGYGLLEEGLPLHPGVKGALAGLAVWVGSYLGWIPALRILTPATRHPMRRNALMIFVHLVWGAVLGVAFERSKKET